MIVGREGALQRRTGWGDGPVAGAIGWEGSLESPRCGWRGMGALLGGGVLQSAVSVCLMLVLVLVLLLLGHWGSFSARLGVLLAGVA